MENVSVTSNGERAGTDEVNGTTGGGELAAYTQACRAQEQAWEPVVRALAERGIAARVEQTGGMVFCIVVPLSEGPLAGGEVAWGVGGESWEGGDAEGERVFGSDVPSDADFTTGIEHERLASYIAESVEEMSTGSWL